MVNRDACSTHAPMETVIGLNLNHRDSCLFAKTVDGEGINKFTKQIVENAEHLVALRLEDRRFMKPCKKQKKWTNRLRGIPIRNDELLRPYNERNTSQA